MHLREIIQNLLAREIKGPADQDIRSIQFDSRKVGKGDLFVAIPGTKTDGHGFIGACIASGARAVVCERLPQRLEPGVTYIRVDDSSYALGLMAAAFFSHPSREIKLVGVTGTNGKTTIATQLYSLFHSLGYGSGLISTIRNVIMEEVQASSHTTPDALQINGMLRKLADMGGEYCFMEVSSHAIDQQRIAGLEFRGAIFTNLTHDHLDYHVTFQEYLKAKKRFFDELGADAFALINTDDKNGLVMTQNTQAKILTYALKKPADFKCRIVDDSLEGLQLFISGREVHCRLAGEFNAYNLLAVYATAILLGQDADTVLELMSGLAPAEGRFETIYLPGNVTAIVDYAHSPDALKNVLETIGKVRTRNEKLIVVVGAGGDRDTSKRPEMGRICALLGDTVILTSDNPRSEDPGKIIEEMKSGIPVELRRKVMAIINRKEAIEAAIHMARSGDIVLVAGKGHEQYQEIQGVRHPFDDRKVIRGMLKDDNANSNQAS
jgi:UDP-N-acetylmuramoyl-L-alanyl-D-glutamate--2,6-diaminopimelate ligase